MNIRSFCSWPASKASSLTPDGGLSSVQSPTLLPFCSSALRFHEQLAEQLRRIEQQDPTACARCCVLRGITARK